MSKDIIFQAGYVASGVGATSLTVTVDIHRITISNLAHTEVVTGGSCTEIGDGVYAYRYASADLQTYYYTAIFKTSGTADVQHLYAVMLDFADSSALPALVWANTTRTLTTGAVTTASATTSRITAYRGTTWSIALTGLGALTGYSKLYFTVKRGQNDTDAQALVQIEIAGGLSRLNGATYGTAGDGSITVNDASAGDITIVLKPAASSKLELGTNLYYDVKSVISSVVTVHAAGALNISADITRAVS